MELPKLSLVAQFDDLVRNRAVLTAGIESDFLKFVQSQDACRKRWLDMEQTFGEMKERLKTVEQENVALNTRLKHARSQIDHELRKRQRTEQERDAIERQIVLVRELLNDKNKSVMLDEKDRQKLAFLSTDFQGSLYDTSPKRNNLQTIEESGSLLSPSDISYDKTEEDLEEESFLRSGRKWKRPSAPIDADVTPPGKRSRRNGKKNHRRSNSADVVSSALLAGAAEPRAESVGPTGADRSRRYSSPGGRQALIAAADEDREGGYRGGRGGVPRTSTASGNSPITDGPGGMKRYNSGNALNKLHVFVTKTVIKSEACVACGKKFRFGKTSIKCKDCRASAHPECKDCVPLPCVPTPVTPGNSNKNSAGVLADYAPVDAPMIPGLVIHCVNEVEARGLSEIGIYRVSGTDREVKELKEKFLKGRGTPNLSLVDDIHVVCGCLKDFLRGLKEPLVTYALWSHFVKAAERVDRQDGMSDLYQAVSMLPQPNRDTVAFLMLHLQRIAECVECKMPAQNLAKVFGPTIVGYSSADLEAVQMLAQTPKQSLVIERLMAIPTDYWTTFINIDNNNDADHHLRDFGTPITPDVPQSMLGPVASHQDMEGADRSRWFSTKGPAAASSGKAAGRAMTSKTTTHFFSSPMLK